MALTQEQLKEQVAHAALEVVRPWLTTDAVVGIGTGSTADRFIDALAPLYDRFAGAVASSERSALRLRSHAIRVFELNDVTRLPVYVDGADEVTRALAMLKGGGGALTREKIVAAAAERFICIADASKLVDTLGAFPLPVEVIPMARAQVLRQLATLCGTGAQLTVRLRADGQAFMTDNGNVIVDISGLQLTDPQHWESDINRIAGVVENGVFARRGADLLLLAGANGVQSLHATADSAVRGLS